MHLLRSNQGLKWQQVEPILYTKPYICFKKNHGNEKQWYKEFHPCLNFLAPMSKALNQ